MGSAYEKWITKSNLQKALASFERDHRAVDRYDTLFVLLLDDGRFDEAALLLDEPGQVVSKALEVAFEKLAREKLAITTAWRFFEAVVEKKPPLYRAPAEEQGPVGLNFRLFRPDKEELCLRAVRLLADAYGIEGELQHGQTLLHRVAVSGLHSPIALLVERGASPAAKDCMDETPFDKLADSLNTSLEPRTFELLKTPGALVKEALGLSPAVTDAKGLTALDRARIAAKAPAPSKSVKPERPAKKAATKKTASKKRA